MSTERQMPIQQSHLSHGEAAHVNEAVYMRVYEIYSHVFCPQQAMIEGGCRGGWGVGEMVAFLYAGNFPKEQWRSRFNEAIKGMKL